MSRELREASTITQVTNPAPSPSLTAAYASYAANGDVVLTFEADFNGDAAIQANAPDPEVVTYRYQASTGRLFSAGRRPTAAGPRGERHVLQSDLHGSQDRLRREGARDHEGRHRHVGGGRRDPRPWQR
jgi:hypothetical protein